MPLWHPYVEQPEVYETFSRLPTYRVKPHNPILAPEYTANINRRRNRCFQPPLRRSEPPGFNTCDPFCICSVARGKHAALAFGGFQNQLTPAMYPG